MVIGAKPGPGDFRWIEACQGIILGKSGRGKPIRASSWNQIGLVMPAANAETMSQHLTAIGCKVAAGSHAVLVLDGAGYHIAAALRHQLVVLRRRALRAKVLRMMHT
jgi:hypothetical protein